MGEAAGIITALGPHKGEKFLELINSVDVVGEEVERIVGFNREGKNPLTMLGPMIPPPYLLHNQENNVQFSQCFK